MAGEIKVYHLLYGSIFLLAAITICDGIICFNCHTNEKPECGDHFRIMTSDADHRFDCRGSCYKRRGKRSSGEVRRTEVQRGCMTRRKNGCFTERVNNLDQYTCVCNTNFCNTASLSYASNYFLLFVLGIVYTLFNIY